MSIALLIALVMLSEGLLHYFPWKKLLKGRELPRVAAYTLGVLGLMIPFTAWLYQCNELETITVLWMVISAGGLIVMALYGLDRYIELEWRDREAIEREALARERHVQG